jgi:DNA-binding NarL/FixJ family response regulator
MVQLAEPLVGRAAELEALEAALATVERGRPAILELQGEPGIGKTRLLAELRRRADRRGHLVLTGSASELERDLPFWVFVDALDDYARGLDPARLGPLGADARTELGRVLPALAVPGAGSGRRDERYRCHLAMRALLELLARGQPLVLALDDLHWADTETLELLASLLRRPPDAPVLLALAVRPRQFPERLLAAAERARRAGSLVSLELGPLSRAEARELLGDAAEAVYAESGGNPFYLEQLTRVLGRTGHVPGGVAAALAEELALLGDEARAVLDGAAVAGDPFEPELAAAAANVTEAVALATLDELLRTDLVRPTDVPRRFRFRHPLVRHAVYEAAPAGWRIAAHERCAAALAARGAAVAVRAHHVERCARQGDAAAIAVLREAGEAASQRAPASAAHFFAAALRLVAGDAERVRLLLARAGALAASAQLVEAREALLESLRLVPPQERSLRVRLVVACAAVERLLARHGDSRRRLVDELARLGDGESPEAAALTVELGADGFARGDPAALGHWAPRAVALARGAGDAPTTAAALALALVAHVTAGEIPAAVTAAAEAAAFVDGLSDDQLAVRLDALTFLAAGEMLLDRFAAGEAHLRRGVALARATGQSERFPLMLPLLGNAIAQRGRLEESAQLLDGAIEAARLSGNAQALATALMFRCATAAAAGDLELAVACGEEARELTARFDHNVIASMAGVVLAGSYGAAGDPARAIACLREATGGERLPDMQVTRRAHGFALLAGCELALGHREAAAAAAASAAELASALGLPLSLAMAGRAAARVALAGGDAARAAEHALSAAAAAESCDCAVDAALARVLAGSALARAGDPPRALAELERAAATLAACGARRGRDEAERELRALGRRVPRRTGPATASGLESLTERELEVARLVVDRRTNGEIAATLFLSKKTVETHLRNIFAKLGVASRVELARAVERTDRDGTAG